MNKEKKKKMNKQAFSPNHKVGHKNFHSLHKENTLTPKGAAVCAAEYRERLIESRCHFVLKNQQGFFLEYMIVKLKTFVTQTASELLLMLKSKRQNHGDEFDQRGLIINL